MTISKPRPAGAMPALALAALVALIPTIAAGQQPAATAQVEKLHWVPADGTSHPVFESAGKNDAIEVRLSFGRPKHPGPNLAARLGQPLKAWRQRTLIAAGGGRIERKVHRRSLTAIISGIEEPMLAVDQLVRTYRETDLPLSEIFLIRRRLDSTGGRGEPVADPRMPEMTDYLDAETFWKAVFDPAEPPPASEDPAGMYSILTFSDGNVLDEIRGMPLFFEDLRLAYGAPEVDVLEPDGRSLEVATALVRNFQSAFPLGSAPVFINDRGESNRVIKVRHGQHVGYSFAIRRNAEKIAPFVVRYSEGFRYREYELLSGIRAAVHELGLAPIVLWNRGSLYIVNLWEPL